jgi:hypothetical protein
MAKDSAIFLLKEPTSIEFGTWTSPNLIDETADPDTSFTSTDNVGFVEQGSFVWNLNDTFVEYLSQTPAKRIRKDLTMRDFGITFTVSQFSMSAVAQFFNLDSAVGLYTLDWIGSDAPVPTKYGWRVTLERTDGTIFKLAIWAGEIVTEDKSVALAGNAYGQMPVTVQSFEHTAFAASPSDKHNYGLIYEATASS